MASPIKYWTPERVVEAIQRWAREHDGVPPVANDWRRPPPGYPSTTSVYRTRARPNGAFRTWNEAIEDAGFTPKKQGNQSGKRGPNRGPWGHLRTRERRPVKWKRRGKVLS